MFFVLLSLALASQAGASTGSTGDYPIDPSFQSFYQASGGLMIFGYPISAASSDSGQLVQFFERQRFEAHPEASGTPYSIQLGLLGVDDAQRRGLTTSAPFQPLPASTGTDANCTFYAQTGHRLCNGFKRYWQTNGLEFGDAGISARESLALFGYPLSEEFVDPGTGFVTQYFERARFEYHPENAGTSYDVLLGLLGRGAADATPTADFAAKRRTSASTGAPGGSTSVTSAPLLFSVYPGGGNGEVGAVAPPSMDQVLASLTTLRAGRPLNVHLYTAWSWYDPIALDADISRYSAAGLSITLTIKYSPPAGHDGDVSGYAAFVQQVVDRYRSNTALSSLVIGNEINNTGGSPAASDGPFSRTNQAVVAGVVVAKRELTAYGSPARVGTDIAVLSNDADAQYLAGLAQLGGPSFMSALNFIGINVYPGLWPVGTGDPYADMASYLRGTRAGLAAAGFGASVAIDVLESGYPTLDESLQANKLVAFVAATCDNAGSAGVHSFSWFDLWDSNTASASIYDHYGLLRSDLSAKPAFTQYQQAIARCSI